MSTSANKPDRWSPPEESGPEPLGPVWPGRSVSTGLTLVALSLLLITPAVSGCDDAPENNEIAPDVLLVISLEEWRGALDSGRGHSAMAFFAEDFLHQGRTADDAQLWVDEVVTGADVKIELTHADISIDGDYATIDYVLDVRHCVEFDDHAVCTLVQRCRSTAPECGWARRWGYDEEQGWRIVGDGLDWGNELALRFESDGLRLAGEIFDPGSSLQRVEATWFSEGEAVSLERQGRVWRVPDDAWLPDYLYPSHPLPWELELLLDDGVSEETVELAFPRVMETFAADVRPMGAVVPPFHFMWRVDDTPEGGTELRVLAQDGSAVWSSPRIDGVQLLYAGPTLEPEQEYRVQVVTFDLFDNHAVTETSLTPLDPTAVSPSPTSVTPTSGVADGGVELLILGSNMLEGARVDIGSTPCTGVLHVSDEELSCTTPRLEPGTYHIAVINPSGESGLLESAFSAL